MDLDGDTELVGQHLQFAFPQADARSIAAAAVGGNDQALRLGVALPADLVPPAADAMDGEGRGIMVDSEIDPARIGSKVVDTVRHRPSQPLDHEVVHADLSRIARRTIFATAVLEILRQPRLQDRARRGADLRHHRARDLCRGEVG
jgi:hypothetical protein